MKWYEKFKVGQKVKVIRKVVSWEIDGCTRRWNTAGDMNITIGKVYEIKQIQNGVGFQLRTEKDVGYKCNYWYPIEALQGLAGTQLEFAFMS